MWGLLDQADAARHAAAGMRRHLHEFVDPADRAAAQKMSERLDARAAEPEHRWIVLAPPPSAARSTLWERLVHRHR